MVAVRVISPSALQISSPKSTCPSGIFPKGIGPKKSFNSAVKESEERVLITTYPKAFPQEAPPRPLLNPKASEFNANSAKVV